MTFCLLSQQIPNDTIYRWTVINLNAGVVLRNLTNNVTSIYTTFTRTGTYEVMVQGWNSHNQTLLFTATTTITVASIIMHCSYIIYIVLVLRFTHYFIIQLH